MTDDAKTVLLVEVFDFYEALESWHLAETLLTQNDVGKAKENFAVLETELSKFGEKGLALIQRLKKLAFEV